MELEESRSKYAAMKKKVRAYQRHQTKKEAHLKNDNLRLREEWGSTLLAYKEKMAEAQMNKEREVEDELCELQKKFDAELRKIADIGDDDDPSSLASNTASVSHPYARPPSSRRPAAAAAGYMRVGGGTNAKIDAAVYSDEENNRPSSSSRSAKSSRELAMIFATATEDAKGKLKRPDERTPLKSHNP